MNVALVAEDAHMEKAICNVLQNVDLRPLPVLEGLSAIPKNTPVMNQAQQREKSPHPIPFQ